MDKNDKNRLSQALDRLRRDPLSSALQGVQELCVHLLEAESKAALSCHEVQKQLPQVVMEEGAGADVDQRYPRIMQHVEQCPDCLEAYVMLSSGLETAEEAVEGPIPDFDLSFLTRMPDPWQVLLEAQAKIIQGGKILVEFFRAPVQPPPAKVPALGKDPDRRLLTAQILEGIEITVAAEWEEPTQCTIRVLVDSPEWESPAGREVHLITSTVERRQYTDAQGQATFTHVPLEDLEGMQIETSLDL